MRNRDLNETDEENLDKKTPKKEFPEKEKLDDTSISNNTDSEEDESDFELEIGDNYHEFRRLLKFYFVSEYAMIPG